MAAPIIRIGGRVDIMPTPRPEIMVVAEPVPQALTMRLTGGVSVPVKNSVITPIRVPAASPTTEESATPNQVKAEPSAPPKRLPPRTK
jgi:hypothetical protein